MDQSTSDSFSFQESSTRLSKLIKKIADTDNMDDENAEEYAERLYDFYSTGHYNLYSATYSWMHRSPTDESDLEYLDRNFKKIMDAYKKKHPDDKNGLEKVTKLSDYILLERARARNQNSLEIEVKNKTREAKLALNKLENLAKTVEESRKESSAQTITVLSIFTGIAMAFFGGFSLLGSAFNNLSYGLPSVAAISLIVGLILFNTIFVFLYVASKISGSPISGCINMCCVDCNEQSSCKDCKHWYTRTFKRYQIICVVCLINTIFIILLVVSVILFFRTGGIKVVDNNVSSGSSTSQSELNHEVNASSSIPPDITKTNPESQIVASSIPSAPVQ